MFELAIPGFGELRLSTLVLDLNGTLSLDGEVLPGVGPRLREFSGRLRVEILTADTHGVVEQVARDLGVAWTRLDPAQCGGSQKLQRVNQIGPGEVVAIGNGLNDVQMLEAAALGIAVVGPEGAAGRALAAADVVVPTIADGLDLLRSPLRLYASLRC